MQLLLLLTATLELFGLAAVAPYMAVVSNPEMINSNALLHEIKRILQVDSQNNFLIVLGVIVLLLVFVGNVFSIVGGWLVAKHSQIIGKEISVNLYDSYLSRDYLFHVVNNSSDLMGKIAQEANRVTFHVIYPLLQINSRAITVFLIVLGLMIIDIYLAIIAFSAFTLSYAVIYQIVKLALEKNGKVITAATKIRYSAMNEGFGGIKELKLMHKEHYYSSIFDKASTDLAEVYVKNSVLSLAPRYILEVLVFGCILSATLYLLIKEGGFIEAFPTLALYAVAAFKLLPAFQGIYSNIASVRSNISALHNIEGELKGGITLESALVVNPPEVSIEPGQDIRLRNVEFKYPGANKSTINNLNLSIKGGSIVGFCGSSGSGKTTVVDIILGLISPDQGKLYVGNNEVVEDNKRCWQKHLSYVPQNIFLADVSVAENIAFGDKNSINYELLDEVTSSVGLKQLINDLPNGINTIVGENGAQLSGGQKQRIGIARALYNDSSVIIFDEATSALDNISEAEVMTAILKVASNKTVIMVAHRLTTLKSCDNIFVFDKGRIVDDGTYGELISREGVFREMSLQ